MVYCNLNDIRGMFYHTIAFILSVLMDDWRNKGNSPVKVDATCQHIDSKAMYY